LRHAAYLVSQARPAGLLRRLGLLGCFAGYACSFLRRLGLRSLRRG
jgi:hypothetical protein